MDKMQLGKWNAAHRILRKDLVFPGFVCRLCEAPCEAACYNEHRLSIRALIDSCGRLSTVTEPDAIHLPKKNKIIAVVGANVEGLACALRLATKKYELRVFDPRPGYGGVLRDRERSGEFLREIAFRFSKEKVDFTFGFSPGDLRFSDYDAVYLTSEYLGEHAADQKVFPSTHAGGSDTATAVAVGAAASLAIEAYLKTGRLGSLATRPGEAGDLPKPGFDPAPGMGLDADSGPGDVVAEAKRCAKCDCTLCLDHCEMLRSYGKTPPQIEKEIRLDNEVVKGGVTGRTMTRQISSCTGCGRCAEVCPVGIDVGLLSLAARCKRQEKGNYPASFHDFWLREMDFQLTCEVGVFPAGPESRHVFFPGCQLGASNPDYVSLSYDFMKKRVDPAAGLLVSCCGVPALWAGDEPRFREIIAGHRQRWMALGKPKVVMACSTCASVWGRHLGEIEQVSLFGLLAADTATIAGKPFEVAAVFDPCPAGADNRMGQAVRAIMAAGGLKIEELEKRGATCCGYGGHIATSNRKVFEAISGNRSNDSPLPYVTYCVNCREVFAERGKQAVHVLDLIYGLDDGSRPAARVNEMRNNSLRLRELYGTPPESQPTEPGHDGPVIVLPEELNRKMDDKRILAHEVLETVRQSFKTGRYIRNPATGRCLGSRELSNVTIWAEFSLGPDGQITVHNTYCHRMRILRD
jgi:Fe-S oxidoreductase